MFNPLVLDPRPCWQDDALAKEITERVLNDTYELGYTEEPSVDILKTEARVSESLRDEFEIFAALGSWFQLL